jgi:myo-inositol 2-dehydrogenase/D-chiro-inositol 1-dehydrogenase
LQEFATALVGGAAPRVNPGDGWAAVVLAEAALESIRTGQPVLIKPTVPQNAG